ncbi:MAG: spore coat protein [Vulcanibacillus sp.]
MQEKEIVNDVVSMLKGSLNTYTTMISEASSEEFRQTLLQLRNSCEDSQKQFANIAMQKGYYQPAPPASQEDIMQVKNQVQ